MPITAFSARLQCARWDAVAQTAAGGVIMLLVWQDLHKKLIISCTNKITFTAAHTAPYKEKGCYSLTAEADEEKKHRKRRRDECRSNKMY